MDSRAFDLMLGNINSHAERSLASSGGTTDPFLIVGICLLIIILLVINVYAMAFYQHPDDKNESILAKVLIVFCLQLTAFSVLMIPIDYANNAGNPLCDGYSVSSVNLVTFCGYINFVYVWESLFCIVAGTVAIAIPFAIVYYEASDGSAYNKEGKKTHWKILPALFTVLVSGGGFLLMLLCLYFLRGIVSYPVYTYSVPHDQMTENTFSGVTIYQSPYEYISTTISAASVTSFEANVTKTYSTLEYTVLFPIYVIALLGWIGWWSFAIFAGVGLTALPFDLIVSFIYRPIKLAPDEVATKEAELQERTGELIDISAILKKERAAFMNGMASNNEKRQRFMSDRIEINKLTQMVFILERDVEELRACKATNDDIRPLVPWVKLFAGIVFTFISVIWLTHIVVYMLVDPPILQFLNTYIAWFDNWFPMFGNLTYAILSLYLLACTMKGVFKIGLRFICIKIHPMVPNGTYTNSFLFNLAIVLFCTVPVIQFVTYAFSGYGKSTDAYWIFGTQIYNLNFYGWFYKLRVFVYIMFITACISIIYLFCRPRDVASSTEDFKRLLQKRGAATVGSSTTAKDLSETMTSIQKSAAAAPATPSKSGFMSMSWGKTTNKL